MKFLKTELPGVIAIEPEVYKDDRGIFFEGYNRDLFVQNGILVDFVQDNQSRSAKGVLRGLHFQLPPADQAKLVRVLRGEVFDVVVDIRKGSKTFGKYLGGVLSAENKKMLYIPSGFAHGFLALTEGVEFLYKVSKSYSPTHQRGVLWSDPAIGIPWPKLDVSYLLSEKDRIQPNLQSAEVFAG